MSRQRFKRNRSAGGGSAPAVLTSADFVYKGMFYTPSSTVASLDLSAQSQQGSGLAVWYDGATPTLLCGSIGPSNAYGMVTRFDIPTPKTSAFNTATELKSYGRIFSDSPFDATNGRQGAIRAMYFDTTDSKLYAVTSYSDYQSGGSGGATISRATLTEGSGVGGGSAVNDGYISLTGIGFKSVNRLAPWRLPSWWKTLYAPSMTHAVGGGFYQSSHTSHDVSMGLCLHAVDLSTFTPGAIASTPMVTFAPSVAAPATGSDRQNRPTTDYPQIVTQDSWPAGKLGWADTCGGAVIINLSDKQGVLCPMTYAQGITQYVASDFGGSGWETWMAVYDLEDLGQVALNNIDPWDVQPSSQWVFLDGYGNKQPPRQQSISSVTISGGTATFTCTGHGFTGQERIVITGAVPASGTLDGGYSNVPAAGSLAILDANRFTVQTSATGTVTGTITVDNLFYNEVPFTCHATAFDPVARMVYIRYYNEIHVLEIL